MKQRKICVFTGSRAEYGLLYFLLKDLQADQDLQLQLLVSGMHLSPEFGSTYTQIEADGFVIDEKVEMLLSGDSATSMAKSTGLGLMLFADALSRLQPDILLVLGDRFEALAIVQAAALQNIPVCHLHGGEITEGAIDDSIRHAISKFSLYHITAAEPYRQRVIQLGESPERVFNLGAIGLEYPRRTQLLSQAEFYQSTGLQQPYFLLTYHPVTLENEHGSEAMKAIFSALEHFDDYQLLVTYPNADHGGRELIQLIENYAKKNTQRVKLIPSLGQLRYFSAVKYSSAVIGNSSSGIGEVPYFNKPTVNIGSRQRGRLSPNSVIHCDEDEFGIRQAITTVIGDEFQKKIEGSHRLFGDGNVCKPLIALLKNCSLNPVKSFYNINTSTQEYEV